MRVTQAGKDIDLNTALFATRFRLEPSGLAYSPRPGGAGWLVTPAEAEQAIRQFHIEMQRSDRLKKTMRRWSVVGIICGTIFAWLPSPIALLGVFVIFGSITAFLLSLIVQDVMAWRAGREVNSRFVRRPAVESLSRKERIRRGLQLGWWVWAFCIGAILFKLLMESPRDLVDRILGPDAASTFFRARVAVFVAVALAALIFVAVAALIQLSRRRSRRKSAAAPLSPSDPPARTSRLADRGR